ncbi:DUF6640 family protein [Nocardia mexicana]|uniref:Uncharacterized protein DUF1109 n=1 Tax=Nocardia mexicana TaxID=279262 RepID=A0A370H6I1_9NOCA|nr:DUF6640 family protein [Nocardia mexicana]RDI51555.1 uncharacterized protein DUF1109 [Nocardia mexicana]
MTARRWDAARILVGIVLGFCVLGPLLADLVVPDVAELHLHNPAWPPHAKFHDAQYIVMSALLGGIGLVMLARRDGDRRWQFRMAAGLAAVTWLGMFGALLFPGTATQDPEHAADNQLILGLDAQLFIGLVMLALLAVALLADHRRVAAD